MNLPAPVARRIVRWLGIAWASPYTLLGLALGAAGLLTGGRARVRSGAIEFHGGAVKWLLRRLPPGDGPAAMTLGHVILGQTGTALDIAARHERVHVRQYERWGPLMVPAYLGCSLLAWLRGRHPYGDNPFERQAFREAG